MQNFLKYALLMLLMAVPVARGQDEVLRVAVFPSKPFAVQSDGQMSGFDIDLWNAVAAKNGWKTDFVIVSEFSEIFEKLKNNEVDAAISNITINAEREAFVDFSHSYMETGLGILVSDAKPKDIAGKIASLWSSHLPVIKKIATAFGLYFLYVILTGFILWLLDIGEESGISDSLKKGVPDAIWSAHAMASTCGFGDIVPKTIRGRTFGVFVFGGGTIFVSYIAAAMTSFQVINQLQLSISSPSDLRGKAVGTVSGTTSTASAKEYGAVTSQWKTLEEACEALDKGLVAAVVYDAPQLKHYSAGEGRERTSMVPAMFDEQNYGIAFQEVSPLREPANRAMLSIRKDGIYRDLVDKYFGSH